MQSFMDDEAREDGDAYGCIFCLTGAEDAVAGQLRLLAEVSEAFVVKKVQHKSEDGVKSHTERVMLPGYVFFRADESADGYRILRSIDSAIRLLTYGSHWALRGDDLTFAKWVFGHDGTLGLSKAYMAGDRVVIESGPLKELEGVIQKVDRHNRNGLVRIEFAGRQINVWLAFELVTGAKHETDERDATPAPEN